MKPIILILGLASFSALAQPYKLSRDVLDASNLNFISHQGPGQWNNYLTMEIPYAPVKKLFAELEARLGIKLRTRGEAHITVITPPEYYQELSSYISMDEIEALAKSMEIQKSVFTIKCLGSGSAMINGKMESTYFLVVESKDLLNIRKSILRTIRGQGGDPMLFMPGKFYAHITVGFTKDDLHESNGIYKDERTCIEKVDID